MQLQKRQPRNEAKTFRDGNYTAETFVLPKGLNRDKGAKEIGKKID